MTRMGALIAVAMLSATQAEVEAARADRAQQGALGWECRYLEGVTPETLPVVQFVVVLASREPLLDHIVPQIVPGTSLVRVRLNALRWSVEDWCAVAGAGRNPYTPHGHPLICRADFLVQEIADSTRSDAYLRLYFGGPNIPKTLADFNKLVGVDPSKQGGFAFGLVEGSSRVNQTPDGARLIRHSDGVNAELWSTEDVEKVGPGKDPLNVNDNAFKPDASEHFALMPRVSSIGLRGVLPVTVLADAQGRIVSQAPTSIVEDHTRFRGQPAIVNPGSCWQCHAEGPQRPSVNAVKRLLFAGAELNVNDKRKQLEVELFHLGEIDTALDGWEKNYANTLLAINGMTPKQNAALFAVYTRTYLLPLTLESAADELGCEPKDLSLALAYASANKIDLGERLPGLAHGLTIPRDAWEQVYLKAQVYLQTWRAK